MIKNKLEEIFSITIFIGCIGCFLTISESAKTSDQMTLFSKTAQGDLIISPEKKDDYFKQDLILVGSPLKLKISRLNLDTNIIPLGVAANGSMTVVNSPRDVTWYSSGVRPGMVGSAVIAGHLDWYFGRKAVFTNLDKLFPGDVITVETDNLEVINFKVREVRVYDKNTDVPEVFSSSTGSHLNLITCTGNWDAKQVSYTKRLVVFSDIVN